MGRVRPPRTTLSTHFNRPYKDFIHSSYMWLPGLPYVFRPSDLPCGSSLSLLLSLLSPVSPGGSRTYLPPLRAACTLLHTPSFYLKMKAEDVTLSLSLWPCCGQLCKPLLTFLPPAQVPAAGASTSEQRGKGRCSFQPETH